MHHSTTDSSATLRDRKEAAHPIFIEFSVKQVQGILVVVDKINALTRYSRESEQSARSCSHVIQRHLSNLAATVSFDPNLYQVSISAIHRQDVSIRRDGQSKRNV